MKKKRVTRILTSLITAALCVSALVGCGSSDGGGAAVSEGGLKAPRVEKDASIPGWQQDNEEHVELTWYVNVTWWDPSWGTDLVTKKIAEDTNVTINFMIGDDTNLNTYFAGEDLPDIITLFDTASPAATTANEWAIPLQTLADTYDPYFYEVAAADTLNWLKLSDGYTYGYSGYSGAEKDYDAEYYDMVFPQQAFVIREDVYKALGEPEMSTPEQFLDVLGQIKEQFPDLIPLGFNAMSDSEGALGARLQNLLGVPLLDENGQWYDRNLDEDYLTWLSVLNKAYLAGYINDDSFADDGTAFNEKIQTGKYAFVIMSGVVNENPYMQMLYSENPEGSYIAIDGPESTLEGRIPIYSNAGIGGWTISYITKNCKDPERAIELFTYLMSDYGEILCFYGIEGETYNVNQDGLYILTDEVKEVKENDPEKYKKEYRMTEFYLFGHDRYNTMGESPAGMKQIYEFGSEKIHDAGLSVIREQFSMGNISPDSNTSEARNLTNIDTNWATTLVSMIRSASEEEFQASLDSYKEFRATNGFDDIVAIYNEKIELNREKLGYK